MKKILILILVITMMSCMARVDLERDTGSLSINIGGNKSSISNVSRAITSNTTKIIISLFNISTHTNITRTIAYTAGQSYNIIIEDLEEGKWEICILTYDESSTPIQTGLYLDLIEIFSNKDTVVTHKFGSPKPLLAVTSGFLGSEWSGQDAPFIGNGENITDSFGIIGFRNAGSTYNAGGSYIPDPSYDHVTVQFIMSKDPEMQKDFVRYYDGNNYLNYYSTSAGYSPDGYGGNYGKCSVSIALSVSNNTFDSLENNTTYYWKAKITNSIGTVESKVFSFKTAMP